MHVVRGNAVACRARSDGDWLAGDNSHRMGMGMGVGSKNTSMCCHLTTRAIRAKDTLGPRLLFHRWRALHRSAA
jgi:hypothetical protein